MTKGLEFTVTMGCSGGHRLKGLTEDAARRLNATFCERKGCGRPLLRVAVTARPAAQKGESVHCPHHANGDPCCLRQERSA